MGCPAAVDAQRRTVDQARLRGTEIHSELGDFLRLDEPLHRTLGKHHLVDNFRLWNPSALCLCSDLLLNQWRTHMGRIDAVGGDALGAALEGDHLGQPFQPVLGGYISRFER